MGGKRIAEQVRRALILAAKVARVAVAIDAAGCSSEACAVMTAPSPCPTGADGPAKLLPANIITLDAGELKACPIDQGPPTRHGGYWDLHVTVACDECPGVCGGCAGDAECVKYTPCLANGAVMQWAGCATTTTVCY